jgi:hypothetical protein
VKGGHMNSLYFKEKAGSATPILPDDYKAFEPIIKPFLPSNSDFHFVDKDYNVVSVLPGEENVTFTVSVINSPLKEIIRMANERISGEYKITGVSTATPDIDNYKKL